MSDPTPAPTLGDVDEDRPIVLLLHGPNLNLLGEREPEVYGTATLDRLRRDDGTRGRRAHGLALEPFQTNHEGELVDAIHGGPRPVRRDHHQPRRLHALRLEHPRRPRRVRRPGRRGAHLQPERPRAVAAHERRRPGRHRLDRRASAVTATSSPSAAVAATLAGDP